MDHSKCVDEGEFFGRDVFRQRRVMHDPTHSVMREQQPEHVLANQLWELAPKYRVAAAEMSLDLVESGRVWPRSH